MQIFEKIPAFILLGFTFFASSCVATNTVKTPDPLTFTSVSFKDDVPLFHENAFEKPDLKIDISVDVVEKSFDGEDFSWLNEIILTSALGKKYAGTTPPYAVEKIAADEISDYKREWTALFKEIGETPSANNIFTISAKKEYFLNSEILVYSIKSYIYRGGAHGISNEKFLNVDLKNKKALALRDVFAGDFTFPLTELLIAQAMEIESVKTREELAERYTPVPTENFQLQPDGILFYYNQYEIAPYFRGAILIKISYEKIKTLLKDDFKPRGNA